MKGLLYFELQVQYKSNSLEPYFHRLPFNTIERKDVMKKEYSRALFMGMVIVCIIMFPLHQTAAQESEPAPAASVSTKAIQVQLLGGIGVYYIGTLNDNAHYRIGADVMLDNSTQSGSIDQISSNTSISPASTSWYSSVQKPDQTQKSYEVTLSGLYIHTVAEYDRASLYCGIGPLADYYWRRSTSTYTYIQNSSSSSAVSSYDVQSEGTQKALGLGGLAIAGVKARLVDGVGLSAELGVSAFHQWTFQSNSRREKSTSTPPSFSTYLDLSSGHLNGWVLSINAIRVGFIIDL